MRPDQKNRNNRSYAVGALFAITMLALIQSLIYWLDVIYGVVL